MGDAIKRLHVQYVSFHTRNPELIRLGLGVKPVFQFTGIVAKRSVFLCFMSTRVELMILT